MKRNLVKIASYTAFGITAAVLGVVITGLVSAQVAPLNCDPNGTGFSGWIACYIGSPTAGIPGAGTLFAGQKALSDKIAAIPGGGGGSSPKVYIERKNANGIVESVYLGQLFQGGMKASTHTWGTDNCTAGTTITVGNPSCPESSLTYANRILTAMFVPDATWVAAHTPRTLTSGIVKPLLCYVREEGTSHLSDDPSDFMPMDKLKTICSYYPSAKTGDVGVMDSYDYGAVATPISQQFRIVIK